jgi:hypothetical protein
MEPGASEDMRVEGMPLEAVVIKVFAMIEISMPVSPARDHRKNRSRSLDSRKSHNGLRRRRIQPGQSSR